MVKSTGHLKQEKREIGDKGEKIMTAKEIIRNTVALKPTDRQAVALLGGASWELGDHGISFAEAMEMEPEALSDILSRVYHSAGSDIHWVVPGIDTVTIELLGGKLNYHAEGPPDVLEPLIQKIADVDTINLAPLHDDPYSARMRKVGALMLGKTESSVGGGNWGPFTFAGLIYGVEELMRGMRKDKSGVHRLLDFTSDVFLAGVENWTDENLDIVSMWEPTASGDMISRFHFEEFVMPALKKSFSALRKKNVITGIHICGNVSNRLDLIAETGAQFISLDYKVSLKKARDIFNGKIAFAGNMDPIGVMLTQTPEGVRAACLECLAETGEGNGFILMPGCETAAGTPLENLLAMTETAHACRSSV